MIQNLQKDRSFYFSYKIDLTKRIQAIIQETLNSTTNSLPDLINLYPNSINYVPQFAFNHNLLQEFKDLQYAPFRTPVIFGFVAISKISAVMSFALISRRDARRPGRRFITRGLDRDGAAANFCETEHIF